jgi:hypothetical protein
LSTLNADRLAHEREAADPTLSRPGLASRRHARDDVDARFEIPLEQLGRLSVADAEPDPDGLQLPADRQPDLAATLDFRQRREERIEGRGGLRSTGCRGGRTG